jgi:hypothetical protein
MRKTLYFALTLTLAAAAAFGGQKIVGPKQTTVDEPFCAG